MASTVADVIVATLKASGVRRVYGLPGDSLNGFTDALRREGEIAWQHVRHEEAAAFAAAGEAAHHRRAGRVRRQLRSGQPAPDQRALRREPQPRSRAGHRRAHPERRNRQQVLPGDPSAGAVPRVQRLLRAREHPEQLPRVLEIAMRTALERRGVAVVVMPGEVFLR